MLLFIFFIILLPEIQSQQYFLGYNQIQCYACSECPEPFFYYHAQTTMTPPDVGQCMKTVVTVQGSGQRLISKGFTRNCVPESSPNVQIYCCSYNLCNRSNGLASSMVVTFVSSIIITFFNAK